MKTLITRSSFVVSALALLAGCGGTTTTTPTPTAAQSACTVPSLEGTVVAVELGDMTVKATPATASAGKISFVAHNAGAQQHELVVLPLTGDVGKRAPESDGKVSEEGSLGEASKTCGADEGDNIDPGSTGWFTATVPAGTYELVCNIPNHYSEGMYTKFVVQ